MNNIRPENLPENPIDTQRRFISLELKYAKPGSGIHPDFLKNRTLECLIPNLKEIFTKTRFVVVGDISTRLYMPERMTLDVDILIPRDDASIAENELRKAGCQKQGILSIGGSIWNLPDNTSVDVIISNEEWIDEAISDPVIASDGLPYIDLPYLVLMKFQSGRLQDMADISRMLCHADEEYLKKTQNLFQIYIPEATKDLESLILLGKLEDS
jgi:hypothetical protein